MLAVCRDTSSEWEVALKPRYGYSAKEWEAARKVGTRLIGAAARDEKTITYSDLVARLETTIALKAESRALADLLDEISKEQEARGRGMLSAVVVRKDTQRPGLGFFKLAQELGRDTSDSEKCWVEEFNRVIAIWKS